MGRRISICQPTCINGSSRTHNGLKQTQNGTSHYGSEQPQNGQKNFHLSTNLQKGQLLNAQWFKAGLEWYIPLSSENEPKNFHCSTNQQWFKDGSMWDIPLWLQNAWKWGMVQSSIHYFMVLSNLKMKMGPLTLFFEFWEKVKEGSEACEVSKQCQMWWMNELLEQMSELTSG